MALAAHDRSFRARSADLEAKGGAVMSMDIVRPVLVMGILLAAGSYAATKEWQWQADADVVPLAQVAEVRDESWPAAAVTVQPEQIFED
jgi:hypothetical protein